jgi:hypothetical protein
VHQILFVPHLIYSKNIMRNPTQHTSHYVTVPTLPPPYIYSFVYASAPKNQWLAVMQCFPYYVTHRIISFLVTNCAKIRKISCACTTELSTCGQRFPVAPCISKDGSALMTETCKIIRRRGAKSLQSLIAMFQSRVNRYITSIRNRHNTGRFIMFSVIKNIYHKKTK